MAPDATERRYKRDPLKKTELTRLLQALPDWHAAINVRHATAKAEGWRETPPALGAYVTAVLGESNLLRRPLILRGDQAIFSRDEAELRAFLA